MVEPGTYPITVAGVRRNLPVVEVAPGVSIAAFAMPGDVELVARAGSPSPPLRERRASCSMTVIRARVAGVVTSGAVGKAPAANGADMVDVGVGDHHGVDPANCAFSRTPTSSSTRRPPAEALKRAVAGRG